MRRKNLPVAAIVVGIVLGYTVITYCQQNSSPAVYNPYPPGILPADLDSETARVLREVDVIEGRAIKRWHSLPPPTPVPTRPGPNPPVLKDTGTESIETLGELLLFDKNMSPGQNQACTSCHMPYAGWSGPIPSVNLTMIAYPGTVHFRAGKRTPQRHTYSPFFPVLQYNAEQQLFFGGNFWDSRATGYRLRNPDAEQAQGPPVDTQEMGFPDTACVAFRLQQAVYRPLFELLWGKDSLDIKFPPDTEEICETPGGAAVFGGNPEPIKLRPEERTEADTVYDHWGSSIDAYEQSVQVSTFTSKFDASLKGNYTMTADEMAGFNLFNGKGNCNSCHVDGRGTTLNPGQVDTSTTATANPPVFPASARPMKDCLSIRGMLSTTRPRRIPLDSSGILTVSATEIWECELSSEVVSAPAPTQTRTGHNMHQVLTANFKCPRCAMWQ